MDFSFGKIIINILFLFIQGVPLHTRNFYFLNTDDTNTNINYIDLIYLTVSTHSCKFTKKHRRI